MFSRHTATKTIIGSIALCLALQATALLAADTVSIILPTDATPRVQFGAAKIGEALTAAGLGATNVTADPGTGLRIYINQPLAVGSAIEGFTISHTDPNGYPIVTGDDDSGALYGCLELARRIHEAGNLPMNLSVAHDQPVMRLRGTCIGMQKTYILPDRHTYEYPYTPELFPWFYDRALWDEYLDFLVANRVNTLYLWNGHPFASLVRLTDYPYAVEVPDDVFAQNQEQFRWLAEECDRRGIWLVQMFYNIIVSKPFAETNNISTQLSAPTPLVSDYTRKSIAEFVKQYPNVGLLVCLGEALSGTTNQLDWCINTILPGVRDGMAAAGLTGEPPIIIRTHAMDSYAIMPTAFQNYANLYTMTKYTGESLTTWQVRGNVRALHVAMAQLGPHIVNIHILADLEPFRYGDVDFIKKSVQDMRDMDATGIHLYPLCYWNWPYSPDKTDPPLLQWRRDWIWFEAWSRYAWNPDIPEAQDRAYWISRLAEFYGNTNAAEKVLDVYNNAGEVAPRLIRRFGITEGNRQTLSLGMTLDQLVNPNSYSPFPDLWLSDSPPGERLDEYVSKEWNHQPHVGETPETIIADVLSESSNAVAAADAADPLVTQNREEFDRVRNDARCIQAMAQNYSNKVRAAELVLRYNKYSHNAADLQQAEPYLRASFADFQNLSTLADPAYEFANSMQTSQRKIPVFGGGGNYLWSQLIPLYQQELQDFQTSVGVDPTPPTPDPMTWQAVPHGTDSTTISMTATTASDVSGVEYFFACTSGGGHDSGWQNSMIYTDTSLTLGVTYSYKVKARDKSTSHNETGWSDEASATTPRYECTAPLAMDFNGDCEVDFMDYAAIASGWGEESGAVVELITNGDFATDLSGWMLTPAAPTTITWDNGTALLARNSTAAAANGNYLYQIIPVVSGKQYQIAAQWKGDLLNGGTGRNWAEVYVGFGSSATAIAGSIMYKKATAGGPNAIPMPWGMESMESILLSPNTSPAGPADGIFTATNSYMTIAFNLGGQAGVGTGYFNVDNVSVMEAGGTPCPEMDLNDDCAFDWLDIWVFASEWLDCNRNPGSECLR